MSVPKLLAFTCVIILISCNSNDKPTHSIKPIIAETKQPAILPKSIPLPIFKKPTPKLSIPIITPDSFCPVPASDIQPSQVFTFNQYHDTTLICEKGTIIKIEHESFSIPYPAIDSFITLNVREYYSIYDFLTANLTTTSNGKILETGGTLFLEAFVNGRECVLKDNKSLTISFPFDQRKQGMIPFTGNYVNGVINWEPLPMDTTLVIDQPATYPGGLYAFKKSIEKYLEYPDIMYDSITNDEIGFVDFAIDTTGRPVDLRIKNLKHEAFINSIKYAFSRTANWTPATSNGRPVRSRSSVIVTFEGENDNGTKTFQENITDSAINELDVTQLNFYMLRVSKLGWINCDRFWDDPRPRANLYVQTNSSEDMDIKLVFHSIKSILPGTKSPTGIVFRNIPIDEKISIIAIKDQNNEKYISITEATSSDGTIANLQFEKTSPQLLIQKLEQLNNL